MNMRRLLRFPVSAALLCLAASWSGTARAQQVAVVGPPTGWVALQPERLDGLRGGLALPSGLVASFGIERVVYVNDTLVISTRLYVSDVARMSPGEARALATAVAPVLLQIGPGNVVTPGDGRAGLTIQNSLDGQSIRSLTTVQVGTSTLGLYQALNAQSALQDALTLRPGP